jgi:outer membrane lipoprotein-sorting protein
MLVLLLVLALAAVPEQDALDRLASALRSSPAWQADFVQVYMPEGFTEGTSEKGTVTIAPPARLRFDYTTGSPRVFATDGSIGRLVDPAAGSCDAVRLDAGDWGRLPLAALLDPAATRKAFTVESEGQTLNLSPRQANPELAGITVELDANSMPEAVTVRDTSGTRNRFTFNRWRPVAEPSPSFFEPHLPGTRPCLAEE